MNAREFPSEDEVRQAARFALIPEDAVVEHCHERMYEAGFVATVRVTGFASPYPVIAQELAYARERSSPTSSRENGATQ